MIKFLWERIPAQERAQIPMTEKESLRIGILGDIHGNLEALRAVHARAAAAGVETFYHLGDLGGYAPFVNEVVAFLREHHIDGIQGNYDEAVAHDRAHCGCKYENPVQEQMTQASFEWTKKHVTPETKEFLKGLPAERHFQAPGHKVSLFHASPHKNNLYWYEDRPERFFMEMSGKTDADILIYGHTHKPYRKDLAGRVFINAGSVGKPKDGDPRACVAILEISNGVISVDFVRVEYDVEKTAAAITASGLPAYFAERLRCGA
jgi:putative phosphoesterase